MSQSMNTDYLLGVWTYRSFYNVPDPVNDFNELRFGQGEMVFEKTIELGALRGQLAFRSETPQKDDPRLTLIGTAQLGSPFTVRFVGLGAPGTIAEGWDYDYIGYFVPNWPNGIAQRPAVVGSVIRTVPHGDGQGGTKPPGVVGSFIAVRRDFVEPRFVIPLSDGVRTMLASPSHRLHHFVWHSTRDLWLDPSISDEQRKKITQLGWAPPRPAVRGGVPLVRNGSGEDFL
jgi:hypothetical protein